jgi:hypothetical protein
MKQRTRRILALASLIAVVSIPYRLAVSFSNKSIASVEYLLGSERLGIAVKPPFELSWNTAYAADGSSEIEGDLARQLRQSGGLS